MHVNFHIHHSRATKEELEAILNRKFGPNDPGVLAKISDLEDVGAEYIFYSCERREYLLACFRSADNETQVTIEPTNSNLVFTADSVWRQIEDALQDKNVVLRGASLGTKAGDFLQGRAGFAAELRRKENFTPVLVGAASLLYVIIGVLTFASNDVVRFLLGCVTGVATAIIVLILLYRDSGGGNIRWG